MFVLERADTMSDSVANRMLKTLEEPAPFVHLILLTDALGQVLPTVVSRCQLVRFDPLPAARIAEMLRADGVDAGARRGLRAAGAGQHRAGAAGWRREEGEAIRSEADPCWRRRSRAAGSRALARAARPGEGARGGARGPRWRSWPRSGWRASPRAATAPRSSASSRRPPSARGAAAQREVLDLGLTLAALGLRDLICLAEGAPEAALGPRPRGELAASARGRDPRRLREAAERCEQARLSLEVNVTEELALSALGYRLAGLVGSSA